MTDKLTLTTQLADLINHLLEKLSVRGTVTISEEAGSLKAAIASEDSALLIGWRGANLAALEHLTRLLLARQVEAAGAALPEIHVDVEGYKQHQIDELTELAHRTASRVSETKAAEVLRPMNAFERRVIHVALSEATDVITESIGADPNRRIMIKPRV